MSRRRRWIWEGGKTPHCVLPRNTDAGITRGDVMRCWAVFGFVDTVEYRGIASPRIYSRPHPLYTLQTRIPSIRIHATTMAADAETFTELPVLPLSRALDPSTRPQFLTDLRTALLNVGFLYLSETGLPDQLVADVIKECKGFFENLPQEEKERIEMKNEKSFLGWSRVSRYPVVCRDLSCLCFRYFG